MSEILADEWPIRIAAARDAQRRSRYAFVVATIVAVAIFIAEFNSTWSWYSQFSSQNTFPKAPAMETRQEAQKQLVQQWIKSSRMTVSLLGVDFGMSDAPVLGSVSLSVISLWFFFCIRRENHLIASVLRDATEETGSTRKTVFHGIVGYLVFTTITNDDEPIKSLDQKLGDHKRFFLRRSIKILIFLPAIAIAFVVFSDIVSLWLPSPVRELLPPPPGGASQSLWMTLVDKMKDDPRWVIQLLLTEAFALVFGTATYFLCEKITKFEEATADILREFEDRCIRPIAKAQAKPGRALATSKDAN
jgi:hypothetical protein